MKILELFGGIGSAREALRENKNIVWEYVDNDKHAVNAYNFLHDASETPQSVVDFKGKLNTYTGIVAGFPCQDVSQAGKGDVEGGKRTILYLEMLRIIKESLPEWIILENVKGLLNTKHLRHYRFIYQYITDLGHDGYDLTTLELTPRQFGIPQSRPRIFIIGIKLRAKIKPLALLEQNNWLYRLLALKTLPKKHPPLSALLDKDQTKLLHEGNYLRGRNYFVIPRKKDQRLISGSYNRIWKTDKFVGALTISNDIKIGETINHIGLGGEIEKYLYYRFLTSNEHARLMGWSRGMTYFASLSRSQMQKLLGNAICIPVLKAILDILLSLSK